MFLTVLVGVFISSCNMTTTKTSNETNIELDTKNQEEKSTSMSTEFEYSDFNIKKSQLGPIKIGMTIQEAEKQFSGLKKVEDYAENFGFGGGSPAFLYYFGEELLFGLIPKLETDTLLFVVAIHRNYKTTNGLNPKSSVAELLEKYPDLMVNQDLMNCWEFFQDKENSWDFVFMTDEETEIGEYPELEVPSKPKRLTTRTDWITIR